MYKRAAGLPVGVGRDARGGDEDEVAGSTTPWLDAEEATARACGAPAGVLRRRGEGVWERSSWFMAQRSSSRAEAAAGEDLDEA